MEVMRTHLIFKIMASHHGRVVGIAPRAHLQDRDVEGLKGPLDGLSIDEIHVHARVESSMADDRLECSMPDDLSLSVAVHREERAIAAVGKNRRAIAGNLKGPVCVMNIVVVVCIGSYSKGNLLRVRGAGAR